MDIFCELRKTHAIQPIPGTLFPYLANTNIFECPSDRAHSGDTYAFNAMVRVELRKPPVSMRVFPPTELTAPSATFLLLERSRARRCRFDQ
jgi:hypothetical protein